jgi:hypothetical protein
VAIGGYVSDLDRGDVLGPVEYTMSRFVVREYCHANEMHQPCFQGVEQQIAPPTLAHLDKLRLYRHACPAGKGPWARLHIEYDATFHAPIPVGTKLRVAGKVVDRYVKRGREYVITDIEMRRAADDALLVAYRDTVILAYQSGATPASSP